MNNYCLVLLTIIQYYLIFLDRNYQSLIIEKNLFKSWQRLPVFLSNLHSFNSVNVLFLMSIFFDFLVCNQGRISLILVLLHNFNHALQLQINVLFLLA